MAGKGKENIHTGHRQRAKSEFTANGLNGLPDHKVLELILFYSIPQGDVNPLAHRLIDHFGSLVGVFHATYDQLLKVQGVGPGAARGDKEKNPPTPPKPNQQNTGGK